MDAPQTYTNSSQQIAFGGLRVAFGVVWLINAWFQGESVYLGHFLDWFATSPAHESPWLHSYAAWLVQAIQHVGAGPVGTAIVVVDVLLALSLLTGLWLRVVGWIGVLYGLFVWSAMGALGEPYTIGATDPGPGIVYAIAFLTIILAVPLEEQAAYPDRPHPTSNRDPGRQLALPRVLFGLLWAFDASWKWHPYFLMHFTGYLTAAESGQPHWIVDYIQFFINVIHLIGPSICALLVALLETFIAVSLLSGKWLRFALPAGVLFTLGIWTTAEGWGGPYGPGNTAMPGNLVGNAILYAYIFAFLAAAYLPLGELDWWRRRATLSHV